MKTIAFFFRKQDSSYHSIETLFDTIEQNISLSWKTKKIFAPFKSTGLIKRILNILFFAFHQSNINHITGDIHYIAFLLRKKKTIINFHDVEILKRNSSLKKKILTYFWFQMPANRVSRIITISEFSKKEILNYVSVPESKIQVIHNCISAKFTFSEKKFNSNCPVILQIGTKKNKNIGRLAEALSTISCKLIIVGKIHEDDINSLNLNTIAFENLINISQSELISIYHQCDILSFISLYEGFGLPVIEANATGRVVIASNVASIPEIAGNAALLVNPLDVSEISHAFAQIIADENKRSILIQNGLENAKRFTSSRIAECYNKIYHELMYEND